MDGRMVRLRTHRLTTKRCYDQRAAPGRSTEWRPRVHRAQQLMLDGVPRAWLPSPGFGHLARKFRAMIGAALGMPSRCRSTPTTPEIMGTPIQFVAGRRAYRDSVRRRVNYNFRYGWRLLHDPPLAPIARLHAVVLRTAVHAVWLHLSRRG